MNRLTIIVFTAVAAFLTIPAVTHAQSADWKSIVSSELPKLGHRNWVAIVNSAYPWQTSGGVETVVSDADQVTVIKQVLADISKQKHVRPIIYTDLELPYVENSKAPGADAYRAKLANIIAPYPQHTLLHNKIIALLDQSGQTFHVLIIKTNMTIPYTSVFINLNCKYWSDANEKALRDTLAAKGIQ